MHFLQRLCGRFYVRRQWLATASVALFATWLLYHVMFGANGTIAYQQKVREYKRLQQEVQQEQAENEHVRQRIKALQSDPQTIEKEAREQLKYAKPGEVIYVLPPSKPAAPSTATAQKH